MSSELREIIGRAPMSRFEVSAVVLCIGLSMLDGSDTPALN